VGISEMANILCHYDKKYGLDTPWDDMSFDNPKKQLPMQD